MKTLHTITEPMLLASGSIDLWQINYFPITQLQAVANAVLTDEELARAARLRVVEPRQRFLFYRLALRYCLARYVGVSPSEIAFAYAGLGKPVLVNSGYESLHFNLTHKSERAYLAIGEHPLGIDWEPVHTRFENGSLARQILHAREMQEYVNIPPQSQADFLLQHWTGKEALVKACGLGMTICPTHIALTQVSATDWDFQVAVPFPLASADWQLQTRWQAQNGALSLVIPRQPQLQLREQSLTNELQEWLNAIIL
jgi:4'-phosphopantetheinyl transferase